MMGQEGMQGQGGGQPSPEIMQMLEILGPDQTAEFLKTLGPEDQQIMTEELNKIGGQGAVR